MTTVELDPHTWSGLEYLESIAGPGAIAEMVENYMRDVPGRLTRMKAQLDSGDRELLGRLAHDLKSNSATLGALQFSTVAAQIEHSAEEASVEDLRFLIQDAEDMLPDVLTALQEKTRQLPS